MKVLAIGDIHTKLWIIEAVKKIHDEYDKIIFVGDYADDWKAKPMDSIHTWQELKDFQERSDKVELVIGNHDYAYAYHKGCSGHLMGTQVLLDVPERRSLQNWLRELPISIGVDGITYSHAGHIKVFDPKDGLWSGLGPLWVRPHDGLEYYPKQVFGHTPVETCEEVQPSVWCIDTFSTYSDGTLIGDQTVLEITDGKIFTKRKLLDYNKQ